MDERDLEGLRRELNGLDAELGARLKAAGFDAERLVRLARPLADAEARATRKHRNRVSGPVSAPSPEILAIPEAGTEAHDRLRAAGTAALEAGEVAFCVMAGGMATRMGGVVKALVEALPGHTFLDMRLRENARWCERLGRTVPFWLMTSEATSAPIVAALRERGAPPHVATFAQDLAVRLTPEARLFRDGAGKPSVYGPGHGDLVDALRRSGLLASFRAAGGKYVWIANLDNLGATLDPVLLGLFVEARAEVMVEVVDKVAGDRGGIPVHADGRLQVLEEFRLPDGFDATTVPVFNTNTFLVDAGALAEREIAWHWFEVEKSVDGKPAIQFERLLQELTYAMRAAYVRVPREGSPARFLPVKDDAELVRRAREIEIVARDRGMT